jgi:hypothetical protein
MLRPQDQTWLAERGIAFRVTDQGDGTHLVLQDVALPAGLEPSKTDILVILPPGFADVGPDMFWCCPAVTGTAGGVIPGTAAQHSEEGRTWQRWSRHIGADWRPGIDNLATYLAYIHQALAQAGTAAQAAA